MAYALEYLGTEAVVEALIEVLHQEDSVIHWQAIRILKEIGAKEAIPDLLDFLETADQYDPWEAAIALGRLGSKEAIPTLLEIMKSRDQIMRAMAAEALGNIDSELVIPILIEAIEDPSTDVTSSVIEALEQISSTETAQHLPQHLPHLLNLIPTRSGQNTCRVILAIQESCKYYNYEVFQARLEAQKFDRPKSQNSDRSPTTIYNIDQVGNLNTGDTNIHGDQIGEQHNHP